jgi:hypothetical protein
MKVGINSKISTANLEYVRLTDSNHKLRTSCTLKVSFTATTAASTTTSTATSSNSTAE